jgi:hypothetical protein
MERDLVEEQSALTRALTSHQDPHIRLLAHISERQLAMHELLSELRKTITENTKVLAELKRTVEERGVRQDEHERQYPLQNGEARHADAQ